MSIDTISKVRMCEDLIKELINIILSLSNNEEIDISTVDLRNLIEKYNI